MGRYRETNRNRSLKMNFMFFHTSTFFFQQSIQVMLGVLLELLSAETIILAAKKLPI